MMLHDAFHQSRSSPTRDRTQVAFLVFIFAFFPGAEKNCDDHGGDHLPGVPGGFLRLAICFFEKDFLDCCKHVNS